MKNTFYILTMFTFFFWSYAQDNKPNKKDTEEPASETREIRAFTNIETSSFANVEIEKGSAYSLRIEVAPSKYLKNYHTEVKNGILKIYIKGTIKNLKFCKVYITTPSLEGVSIDGMSEVELKDTFEAENFKIEANSMAKFKGNIVAQDEISIKVNGQAKVEVEVKCKELEIAANSMGVATVSGAAKRVNFKANSMAKINARELQYEEGKAKSNSMAKIKTNRNKLSEVSEDSQGEVIDN